MNVPPQQRALRWASLAFAALGAVGCVSHTHVVGLGPTGTGSATARQFYILFGLVPLNTIDTQRLAPDLTSYAIDTRFSFVDLLCSPLLLPFTMTTRTVTVRT